MGDLAVDAMSVRPEFARLPTVEEVAAARLGKPILKGTSRLQATIAARPLTKVDEKEFKRIVRLRDRHRCRMCGRKVRYVVERVPERGEVHHVHGKVGDLKFEDRCALLLCLEDHERCTGRVNEKYVIVPTKTIVLRGETCTDARAPVSFVRIA